MTTNNNGIQTKTTIRFHLDSPYHSSNYYWPEVSSSINDQETILELLCSLLNPIGIHRQNHITPSKGKRSKKRKRQHDISDSTPKPPLPEITSQILIGFNSIIRHLQDLSQDGFKENAQETDDNKVTAVNYIAAIFTTHPSPSQSILHSHFPLLVNTASLSHPTRPPIRLVQLPKGCEGRLAATLALPRVNFIAVMEKAEGADVLLELVKEKVGIVDGIGLKRGEAIYQMPTIVGVKGKVGMTRKERRQGLLAKAEEK